MLKILWPLSFKEAPCCVFKSISNFWNKQNEFVDFMIVGKEKIGNLHMDYLKLYIIFEKNDDTTLNKTLFHIYFCF